MNKIIIACVMLSFSSAVQAEAIIVDSNVDNTGDTTPAYSIQTVPSAPGTVTTEIGPNPYVSPYQVQVPNNARTGSGITGGAMAAPSGSIAAPSRSIAAPTRSR